MLFRIHCVLAAILLPVSALNAAGAPANANAVMAAYFSNTLVCRSDRLQCHIWFESDGTYRRFDATLAEDGTIRLTGAQGNYTIATQPDGSTQTCLSPGTRNGPRRAKPACYQLSQHKSGDAWDASDSEGKMVHFSLQAGRHVNAGAGLM